MNKSGLSLEREARLEAGENQDNSQGIIDTESVRKVIPIASMTSGNEPTVRCHSDFMIYKKGTINR